MTEVKIVVMTLSNSKRGTNQRHKVATKMEFSIDTTGLKPKQIKDRIISQCINRNEERWIVNRHDLKKLLGMVLQENDFKGGFVYSDNDNHVRKAIFIDGDPDKPVFIRKTDIDKEYHSSVLRPMMADMRAGKDITNKYYYEPIPEAV